MSDEPRWRRYLRLRGPDAEADIDDELRFHLEMREREVLEAGGTPEEARAAARASFGDVEEVRRWLREHDRKRERRRERGELWDQLRQDVRYGARKLRQQPGFTAAAVLVLALGIGATAAIFSAVDAVLLRPLFAEEERLVKLDVDVPFHFPGQGFPKAAPDIRDARGAADLFAGVGAYAPGGMNLTGAGAPLRVRIGMVTPDLFPLLGVRPRLGRGFAPEEERARVAILSEGLWRRQFGGDRGVLGRVVTLNGRAHRVVGVMPRGVAFPRDAELWLPMPVPLSSGDLEAFRQWIPTEVVGRLAPGVTLEQARTRVLALQAEYRSPGAPADPERAARAVLPLRDTLVAQRRTALLMLLGATALVLLVACANVANLLLSRAAARRRELALRSVLGATRGRVARQLLVESLLLAGLGGALGLGIAWAGTRALRALVPPELAGVAELGVDGRVLLFTLGVALLAGLGFGVWPALGAGRPGAGATLRMAGPGSVPGGESPHLRRALVITELALALMLLAGAGVMLRSFQALLSTDPGLDPERVATLELTLHGVRSGERMPRDFMEAVLARLQADPGVEAAALVNELPLRGEGGIGLSVRAEGSPAPRGPDEMVFAQDLRVTPDYFRALAIPLLRGRTFPARPRPGGEEVVVNQELAGTLWPGEDPLGKRLLGGGAQAAVVVGVVGNVRRARLEDEVTPQMYAPILDAAYPSFAVVARGRVPARALTRSLEEAVRAVAPDQAVYNVRPMEEVIASTLATRRTSTVLISLFGALALALAAVGVYGVIAYGVARRTREIGIRIALGAHPRRVVREMMREGVALAGLGTALGLAGAWALARVLAGLVYAVSPQDPLTFVLAPLALFAVATLATLLPARRAARVDPAAVLRAD